MICKICKIWNIFARFAMYEDVELRFLITDQHGTRDHQDIIRITNHRLMYNTRIDQSELVRHKIWDFMDP